MYVNQIDNIIDQILDKLYLEGLLNDPTFNTIIQGKKLNYVEYYDKINEFIKNFVDNIDTVPIQQLIRNRENLQRIMDIIKRYVAYYYFLSIAYYYTGTIKEYRNNLIQYSKLQEHSSFSIKNFFDTENNYQIVTFFKIIKDVIKLITATDLQKKTFNQLELKGAITFLNSLGREYIDNFLLTLRKDKNGEEVVEINVHNLIKTIVFREIYRNQEQTTVFEILNEIQENENEYTYIDIIVSGDELVDFSSFIQIFLGDDQGESKARDLYELILEANKIVYVTPVERKNNKLLGFDFITPIVDDFLRYHRDSEHIETDSEKNFAVPYTGTNNAKNIQLALLYQQRKKKENTKAQLIITRIDTIRDLYSDNVKNNPELTKEIKKYFNGPLSHRKAVTHNYLDEVYIIRKIVLQGRRAIEGNEYYLELKQIVSHAYFNFNDFMKYGTTISLENDTPLNMLRYSNIEYKNQLPYQEVETRTGNKEDFVNLVGLAVGPITNGPLQCIVKENTVDIRSISISYLDSKQKKQTKPPNENGYKTFMRILKHFYVDTIQLIVKNQSVEVVHDFDTIIKLNPTIKDKIIYWVYDVEKDKYKIETYENVKIYNFQENIRYMNAIIYDKLINALDKKLVQLFDKYEDLSMFKIEYMLQLYSIINNLFLTEKEKRQFIIEEYLHKKVPQASQLFEVLEEDKVKMPEIVIIPEMYIYKIQIDMINPLHIQPYRVIKSYSTEPVTITETKPSTADVFKIDSKCQHEIEWKEIMKFKRDNLIRYNSSISQFIERFSLETRNLEFVCRICGQLLLEKQYVQDGKFNNATQRFITDYAPIDIPLEEIREYKKYKLAIKYLDGLVNRISLITATNMLIGATESVKHKRKAIVKNVIDLLIKHNTVNLHKSISDEERAEFYAKKFNIDSDLSGLFFFELDDSIFDFTPSADAPGSAEINRLKFNNILLYFILIFITELNGAQITMMFNDRIANIYTYLKYGSKLFGNLLIKKNISDLETVPITNYPVLCYLIYVLSYFLLKYKIWYHPNAAKAFNPAYTRIIINSFVELFNSVSIDTGKMPNDYVYMLTSSKMYTQLNTIFKNDAIIKILKQNHIRFAGPDMPDTLPVVKDTIETYSISHPYKWIRKPIILPSYKITSGLLFDTPNLLVYHRLHTNTNETNCNTGPIGDFHAWHNKGTGIMCSKCGKTDDEITPNYDSDVDTYYFNLNKIANRRCLTGRLHDFVGSGTDFICSICHRKLGEKYSREELDTLADNLDKIIDENAQKVFEKIRKREDLYKGIDMEHDAILANLKNSYKKEFGDKIHGQLNHIVDDFIKVLEEHISPKSDLGLSNLPIYLQDDVYIIDHSYDGTPFKNPIIITQKENKIFFKEDHPFFKVDVYYYTDNRATPIDVFYHAVTLRLLGYKEKHKEYILTNKLNNYLQINQSIRNRLLTVGYKTKYIDINDIFAKNSKLITDSNENLFRIMNSLIREHVYNIRAIVDKIISIIYKIKFFKTPSEADTISYLKSAQTLTTLISKYSKLIREFNVGENNIIFNDWGDIQDLFSYEKIDWNATNVRANENMSINTELVNYYDSASTLMMFYLLTQLKIILNSNHEKNLKVNICQMYIDIINYVYGLYNIDATKNILELKRFDYILKGSSVTIDLLRKGLGLEAKINEEQIETEGAAQLTEYMADDSGETLSDLREEADALDVEIQEWEDENDEYEEGGDYGE